MIPKVANRGHSFKGVVAYLMHDKRDQEEQYDQNASQSSERVAWTETSKNIYTSDLEKAAKVMAWTDKHSDWLKEQAGVSTAGKNPEAGAVYHYSLAWAKGETPDQEHQREAAIATLEKLGLEEHQYMLVAHNDTAHSHVHVVVNLTHPETGMRNSISHDRTKLQAWALEYEQEHGMHCEMRQQNAELRAEMAAERRAGRPSEYIKHQDRKMDYSTAVTRAFQLSDNGVSFQHALRAEGLQLARHQNANKFNIVDQNGGIQALTRNLDPVDKYDTKISGRQKGDLIRERLSDIDVDTLPHANELSAQIKAGLAVPRDEDGKTDRQQDFKKVSEPQEAQPQEKDPTDEQRGHQPTTGQIADDYVELARNPLSDLRGWLDETEQRRQEGRGLFAGSQRSGSMDSPLRPLPEAGDGTDPIAAKVRAEKWAAYEAQKSARIDERKEYWQISKLEIELDQAQAHYEDHSGWFYRWIYRSKFNDARDDVLAKQMNLDHARDRWKQDIEAIHASRPQWAIDKELQSRGFGDTAVNRGEGQERTTMEAAEAKAEFENQALIEAQSSDEAAARLDGTVVAKTGAEKAKVARVHARADEYKAKVAAKKKEQQQEDDDRQHEREHRDDEKKAIRAKQVSDLEREEAEKKAEKAREQHDAQSGWFTRRDEDHDQEQRSRGWFRNDDEGQDQDPDGGLEQ